jgi:ABC-type transporter Mla subunit MlaD
MATFTDTFSSLRQQFDQASQNRRQFIRDLQAEVKEHAAQTAHLVTEQATNRMADFTKMMGDLRTEVQVQAARTRDFLGELAADLRRGGEAFRGRAGSQVPPRPISRIASMSKVFRGRAGSCRAR